MFAKFWGVTTASSSQKYKIIVDHGTTVLEVWEKSSTVIEFVPSTMPIRHKRAQFFHSIPTYPLKVNVRFCVLAQPQKICDEQGPT